MFETCQEIRNRFDDYMEGACDRATVQSIRYHLDFCQVCSRELECRETLDRDLGILIRERVPAELGLRLRVIMSRELHRNILGRLMVRLDNALKPFLLPASAGVLTAIICFGLIMGSQAFPASMLTPEQVAPWTPPRVVTLAPLDLKAADENLVVVTHIDSDGRVIDYAVLSGSCSPALLSRLDRMMFFSIFEPATTYGKPTDGQVVLSLRRITVRG